MVLAVPLSYDLGHDDRVFLPELCHLLLHNLVPDLSDQSARLLARAARHARSAARTLRDPKRMGGWLHLRCALPSWVEPDRGAQDLPGRWHAGVFSHHTLRLCAKCVRSASMLRDRLWQPGVRGCEYLVAARCRGAHTSSRGLDRRHP